MKQTFYTDASCAAMVIAKDDSHDVGVRDITIEQTSITAKDCRELAIRLLQLADKLDVEVAVF